MNDAQMALLSKLAYLDRQPDHAKTVEELINYYITEQGYDKNPAYSDAFKLISQDKELMNLKISGYENQNKLLENGMAAYCFETSKGEAVYAFRGTDNWIGNDTVENLSSISSPIATAQQMAALKFVKDMQKSKNYKTAYATGHSLGGSLAQYVALNNSNIKSCAVFNSRGFSTAFRLANAIKIAINSHKITSYSTVLDPLTDLQWLAGLGNLGMPVILGPGDHDLNNVITAFDKKGRYKSDTSGSQGGSGSGGGGGGAFGSAGSAVGRAMSKELRVDASIVKKISGEMLSIHSEMSQTMRKIDEEIRDLKTKWGGIVSGAYQIKYSALKPDIERMLDVAKEYADDLNSIADIYAATEQKVQDAVGTLTSENVFVI